MAVRFVDVVEAAQGAVQVGAAVVGTPLLRQTYLRWGSTPDEVRAQMPGDDLVVAPKLGYTRAITVDVGPARVWPWLAQMGQGRGGLYSFDALENLARCDIHSAGRILPEHQHLAPGDVIRLGRPQGYPCFRVASVDPPYSLVLVSVDPVTHEPPLLPVLPGSDALAETWQWLLRPLQGGRSTRLLVRQRLTYPARMSLLWHLVEPVAFAMERRMLHGIKERAERR